MTKALDTPLVRIVDDDAEQLKSLAFLLRMGGHDLPKCSCISGNG